LSKKLFFAKIKRWNSDREKNSKQKKNVLHDRLSRPVFFILRVCLLMHYLDSKTIQEEVKCWVVMERERERERLTDMKRKRGKGVGGDRQMRRKKDLKEIERLIEQKKESKRQKRERERERERLTE
jgi:hypothetical protein